MKYSNEHPAELSGEQHISCIVGVKIIDQVIKMFPTVEKNIRILKIRMVKR